MAVGVASIKRFNVYLVALDPTLGSEIQKTRPCLIISPDEMNRHIRTVIVAPLTSRRRDYPTRVNCTLQGAAGQIVLDQIRTVDKMRLVKRLGKLDGPTQGAVHRGLEELFAP
jgi:mRNA interferase MazF